MNGVAGCSTTASDLIALPPLRERPEDVPLLAAHFARRAGVRLAGTPLTPSAADTELLLRYSWPGNVRELENAIERAVILASNGTILPGALPDKVRQRKAEPLMGERLAVNPSLETIERAYIMWVLGSESGNKSRAADVLGIDPSTLHRKLSKFGIEV